MYANIYVRMNRHVSHEIKTYTHLYYNNKRTYVRTYAVVVLFQKYI